MWRLQCPITVLTLLLAVQTLVVSGEPQKEHHSPTFRDSSSAPNNASPSSQKGTNVDVSVLYELLDRVLAAPPPQDLSKNHPIASPSSHFILKLCHDDDGKKVQKFETTSKDTNTKTESCSCSIHSNATTTPHGWFCMEQEHQQEEEPERNTTTPSRLVIMGSSVSEISYGIGYYFRYYCNFSLGWERIGGNVRNLTLPDQEDFPLVPHPIHQHRRVPWSYLMNVCTHSYSLVWYDWNSSTHGWEAFLDWASLMGINNLLACKHVW